MIMVLAMVGCAGLILTATIISFRETWQAHKDAKAKLLAEKIAAYTEPTRRFLTRDDVKAGRL